MYIFCRNFLRFFSHSLDDVLDRSPANVLLISFAFASVWSKLVFDSFLTLSVVAVEVLGIQGAYLYTEVSEANIEIFDLVIFAPLVETLIHQGIIQSLVSKYFSSLVSLVANVFLFSIFHLFNDLSSFVGAIGSGVMFFLVYEHFRRRAKKVVGLLWVTLLHAFWNMSLLYTIF